MEVALPPSEDCSIEVILVPRKQISSSYVAVKLLFHGIVFASFHRMFTSMGFLGPG